MYKSIGQQKYEIDLFNFLIILYKNNIIISESKSKLESKDYIGKLKYKYFSFVWI